MREADTIPVGEGVEQLGPSHIAGKSVKWYNDFTKGVTISCKSPHKIAYCWQFHSG